MADEVKAAATRALPCLCGPNCPDCAKGSGHGCFACSNRPAVEAEMRRFAAEVVREMVGDDCDIRICAVRLVDEIDTKTSGLDERYDTAERHLKAMRQRARKWGVE